MPSLVSRCLLQNLVQPGSQTLAHLVCRSIRERDGNNLIDGKVVLAQDVQVTLDQHGGLAGTRPGGHRDVFLDLVCGRSLFGLQFAFLIL